MNKQQRKESKKDGTKEKLIDKNQGKGKSKETM
jgi:hypothetical protein